jgi:hypothetical protein
MGYLVFAIIAVTICIMTLMKRVEKLEEEVRYLKTLR